MPLKSDPQAGANFTFPSNDPNVITSSKYLSSALQEFFCCLLPSCVICPAELPQLFVGRSPPLLSAGQPEPHTPPRLWQHNSSLYAVLQNMFSGAVCSWRDRLVVAWNAVFDYVAAHGWWLAACAVRCAVP
eukprot:2424609-Rhodomonas_salina.3